MQNNGGKAGTGLTFQLPPPPRLQGPGRRGRALRRGHHGALAPGQAHQASDTAGGLQAQSRPSSALLQTLLQLPIQSKHPTRQRSRLG